MEIFIEIIMYLAVAAFWIGLVKPSWVGMSDRKSSSTIFFVIILMSASLKDYFYPKQKSPEELKTEQLVLAQAELDAKKFKYPDLTIGKYQSKPKSEREDIVSSFLISEDLSNSAFSGFYNCLSENAATKNNDLQIGIVLGWCANDYKENPKLLDSRTNFDEFFSQFSGWDGSYRPLEKVIKESMHDRDSYKHLTTTYRILMKGTPHAIVSTTFSGTNAYAARVQQTISADVDVNTGQIISVIGK